MCIRLSLCCYLLFSTKATHILQPLEIPIICFTWIVSFRETERQCKGQTKNIWKWMCAQTNTQRKNLVKNVSVCWSITSTICMFFYVSIMFFALSISPSFSVSPLTFSFPIWNQTKSTKELFKQQTVVISILLISFHFSLPTLFSFPFNDIWTGTLEHTHTRTHIHTRIQTKTDENGFNIFKLCLLILTWFIVRLSETNSTLHSTFTQMDFK